MSRELSCQLSAANWSVAGKMDLIYDKRRKVLQKIIREKAKENNHMKKFMKEFKAFIARGNVMDMAVGIIIGGAFTTIVSSLVEDIINPILGIFGGMNFDQLSVNLAGGATLNYGKFITAIINFVIMALVVFIIVKIVNGAVTKLGPKKEEEAPKSKKCPFCKSDIHMEAVRCPHCTSELESK